MALFFLATVLPIHTAFGVSAHSMYSDNRTTNLLVMLLTVLPLVGLVGRSGWITSGWVAGSLTLLTAWAIGAVAVTIMEIRVPATSGDPLLMDGRGGGLHDPALAGDPGPAIGLVLMTAAAILGILSVGAGVVAHRRWDDTPRVPGSQWAVGIVTSAALTVGLMLPAGADPTGFVDRNFQTGDLSISIAWLVIAASFGAVGVVGFVSRSWWGLAAVAASVIPAGWLAVIDLRGLDTPNEPGPLLLKSAIVHPLMTVALVGQVAVLAVALVRVVRQTAAEPRASITDRSGTGVPAGS